MKNKNVSAELKKLILSKFIENILETKLYRANKEGKIIFPNTVGWRHLLYRPSFILNVKGRDIRYGVSEEVINSFFKGDDEAIKRKITIVVNSYINKKRKKTVRDRKLEKTPKLNFSSYPNGNYTPVYDGCRGFSRLMFNGWYPENIDRTFTAPAIFGEKGNIKDWTIRKINARIRKLNISRKGTNVIPKALGWDNTSRKGKFDILVFSDSL